MNLLLLLFDGKVKILVTAVDKNGIFHTSALKSLEWDFGNTYAVAYLKLRKILDFP